MGFKLEGEVIIDGRKGTIALKEVQREANRTSESFKRAGGNTERLGKSLLSLGLHAGRAGTSLGALSRLGAGGLFGAAVLGSINKFGETVKQASTDYYQSQKALSDAFEMSFKSTSVEQAQQGLEKTEDTIESLRGKITQLGTLGGFLKGLEKFTGINLGVGDSEKALKDAQNKLIIQEGIVAARIKERDVLKATEGAIKSLGRQSEINKIDLKIATLKGNALDENVLLAEEELRTLETTTRALLNQYNILNSITDAKKNQEAIDTTLDMLAANRVKAAQAEYNLLKAKKDQEAKNSKQAQEAGGGLLGASRAGQQALDTARKVRAREVSKEDFKTQEQVFGTMRDEENKKRKEQNLPPLTIQDIRNRVATQQAAGEAPTLAEQFQGRASGIDPAQLARETADANFQKNMFSYQAPSMSGTVGKLGEEKSPFPPEALNALKEIADLLKTKLPAAVAQ